MQLTVVVENQTSSRRLVAEWSYSASLETDSGVILLDTGGIQHTLPHNLAALGLDGRRIGDLILSHGHFDHVSGLTDVLRLSPHARLWAAPTIGRERRGNADGSRCSGGGALLASLAFNPVAPYAQVAEGVTAFTVPQAERDPRWVCTHCLFERDAQGHPHPDSFADDVSVLVQTERGASVLLGCAHAGIPNILAYARKTFGIEEFEMVLGGTHLGSMASEELPRWMQALKAFKGAPLASLPLHGLSGGRGAGAPL